MMAQWYNVLSVNLIWSLTLPVSYGRRCFVDVRSIFGRCFVDVRSIFGRCFVDVWSLFRWCSIDVPSMFRPCFVDVSSMFRRCFEVSQYMIYCDLIVISKRSQIWVAKRFVQTSGKVLWSVRLSPGGGFEPQNKCCHLVPSWLSQQNLQKLWWRFEGTTSSCLT